MLAQGGAWGAAQNVVFWPYKVLQTRPGINVNPGYFDKLLSPASRGQERYAGGISQGGLVNRKPVGRLLVPERSCCMMLRQDRAGRETTRPRLDSNRIILHIRQSNPYRTKHWVNWRHGFIDEANHFADVRCESLQAQVVTDYSEAPAFCVIGN